MVSRLWTDETLTLPVRNLTIFLVGITSVSYVSRVGGVYYGSYVVCSAITTVKTITTTTTTIFVAEVNSGSQSARPFSNSGGAAAIAACHFAQVSKIVET